VFTNILVGLDGSPSSQRALEHAIDLARAGGAKLTLMTVAPPVATYVTLGGVSIETMSAELDKWATNVLDEAARTVPPDVTADRVQGSGQAGPEIVNELKRGGYDLIVLGTRGRGRTQGGPPRQRERLHPLSRPDPASVRARQARRLSRRAETQATPRVRPRLVALSAVARSVKGRRVHCCPPKGMDPRSLPRFPCKPAFFRVRRRGPSSPSWTTGRADTGCREPCPVVAVLVPAVKKKKRHPGSLLCKGPHSGSAAVGP
jgi:nucleotide-binding universal stress UspA family protein